MASTLQTQRDQSLGRLLLLLERHFTNQTLAHLKASGINDINLGHFAVLPYVDETGIRATEIAQKSGISKQAAGKTIEDLKEKGYLTTSPDPRDKRASLVHLSEKGVQMMKTALKATEDVEKRWDQLNNDVNVQQLKTLCSHLLEGLNGKV